MAKVSVWNRDRLGGLEVKLALDRGSRESLVVQYARPVISASENPAFSQVVVGIESFKVASIRWKHKDYFVRISVLQKLLLTA